MRAVLDANTVREWGELYSNWGRWSDDDQPFCRASHNRQPRRIGQDDRRSVSRDIDF